MKTNSFVFVALALSAATVGAGPVCTGHAPAVLRNSPTISLIVALGEEDRQRADELLGRRNIADASGLKLTQPASAPPLRRYVVRGGVYQGSANNRIFADIAESHLHIHVGVLGAAGKAEPAIFLVDSSEDLTSADCSMSAAR